MRVGLCGEPPVHRRDDAVELGAHALAPEQPGPRARPVIVHHVEWPGDRVEQPREPFAGTRGQAGEQMR
jgi:hypothetical protein